MATVAERYGLPRFVEREDADKVRNWARTATEDDLRQEHRALRDCMREFPRYRLLLSWIETVADLRGIDLFPSDASRVHAVA